MYLFLANTVVVIHYAFMVWVMFGALAVVRWPKLAWGHLPAVAWAVIMMTVQAWTCPLTWLELQFRAQAHLPAYDGGFLHQYVHPMLMSMGVSATLIPYFGYILLAINAGAYSWLIASAFRRRHGFSVTAQIPAPSQTPTP